MIPELSGVTTKAPKTHPKASEINPISEAFVLSPQLIFGRLYKNKFTKWL